MTLVWPGMTSIFIRNGITQNEWMTSGEVSTKRTVSPFGSHSVGPGSVSGFRWPGCRRRRRRSAPFGKSELVRRDRGSSVGGFSGRRRVAVDVLHVVEAPAPLEAHHVDDVLRLLRGLQQLGLVPRGEVEQHRDRSRSGRSCTAPRSAGCTGSAEGPRPWSGCAGGRSRSTGSGPRPGSRSPAPRPRSPARGRGSAAPVRWPGWACRGGDSPCTEQPVAVARTRPAASACGSLRRTGAATWGTAHALAVGEVGAVGTHVAPSRESRPRVRVSRPSAGRSARARA